MRVVIFISLLAALLVQVDAGPKPSKPHERRTQSHTSTAVAHETKMGQIERNGPVSNDPTTDNTDSYNDQHRHRVKHNLFLRRRHHQ